MYRPEGLCLSEGVHIAHKYYIQGCCDPSVQSDPDKYSNIGGYIHIATITVEGFRWVIPPRDFDCEASAHVYSDQARLS
jgi:hypothetical protein